MANIKWPDVLYVPFDCEIPMYHAMRRANGTNGTHTYMNVLLHFRIWPFFKYLSHQYLVLRLWPVCRCVCVTLISVWDQTIRETKWNSKFKMCVVIFVLRLLGHRPMLYISITYSWDCKWKRVATRATTQNRKKNRNEKKGNENEIKFICVNVVCNGSTWLRVFLYDTGYDTIHTRQTTLSPFANINKSWSSRTPKAVQSCRR